MSIGEISSFSDCAQRLWWVGVGGFLGANARYWISTWIQYRLGNDFPWATFLVNISGSFLLGVLMPLVTERIGFPNAQIFRLLIAVGFLGAYTTFSTYEYEALSMLTGGAQLRALVYLIASVIVGLLSIAVGIALGRVLNVN